jgi:BirA family biotin operon repressor/biotin-[acetyl-CoA-carboxylase] ligase
LLKAHLRALSRAYAGWQADPVSVAPLYRSVCTTLGRRVRLELPGGEVVSGIASDVDADGRLVIEGRGYGAGDVLHLR